MSAIHRLVEKGNASGVLAVIAKTPQVVNQVLSKAQPDQPLHLAAWQNASEIARILISNGANVDARGDNNRVPIHYAAQHGGLEVAKVLIDAGAELDLQDANGFTALILAVRGREPSCIKAAQLLRSSGAFADLNSLVSLGETRAVCQLAIEKADLETAIEPSSLVEDFVIMIEGKVADSGFYNPDERQAAIASSYEDMLACLLKLGAEMDAIGSTGYPALFTAVQSNIPSLVRLLLENGADVNYRLDQHGRVVDAVSLTSGDEGREVRKILSDFGFKKN